MYPEKVEVERMFRQMAPQPVRQSAEDPDVAESTSGPWRVVTADGSTSVFSPVPPADRIDSRQPADQQPDANRRNIAMPAVVPDLSEMLEAGGQMSCCDAGEVERAISVPKPGVAVVVESHGDLAVRHAAPWNPIAAASAHRPPKSRIPPQASKRCRDIDSHLARVIDVWAELPRGIRAAISAMIEAARDGQ